MDGGCGDDVINVVNDVDIIAGSSLVTNKINGGDGKDRITVLASTQFFGLDGSAINGFWGGDGHDTIDATAVADANSADLASNVIHAGRGNDVVRAYNQTNSNSADPVGLNELWGDEGNDVLEAFQSTGGNAITHGDRRASREQGSPRQGGPAQAHQSAPVFAAGGE